MATSGMHWRGPASFEEESKDSARTRASTMVATSLPLCDACLTDGDDEQRPALKLWRQYIERRVGVHMNWRLARKLIGIDKYNNKRKKEVGTIGALLQG